MADVQQNVQFGEELLLQDMELVDCLAVGGKTEEEDFCFECKSICQRASNPCIVDIDYEVCGPGVFEFVPELTAFSLDTTNGINGTWHLLQSIQTDPLHSGDEFEATTARFTGRYVADLCDHVSGFFSEPKICFRLTVRKIRSSQPGSGTGTGGPYHGPPGGIPPGTRLPSN